MEHPRTAILLLWSFLFLAPASVWAQEETEVEYRLKLAFLFHLAQFVEWPDSAFSDPASPLDICVSGQDPFKGDMEESLRGRTVDGHPVRIIKVRTQDSLKECHMIFFHSGGRDLTNRILRTVKELPTLTVGETKGFAELGGVVNLVLDDNRLRFEVNLDAASQTRLKISAKVLALATIVKLRK